MSGSRGNKKSVPSFPSLFPAKQSSTFRSDFHTALDRAKTSADLQKAHQLLKQVLGTHIDINAWYAEYYAVATRIHLEENHPEEAFKSFEQAILYNEKQPKKLAISFGQSHLLSLFALLDKAIPATNNKHIFSNLREMKYALKDYAINMPENHDVEKELKLSYLRTMLESQLFKIARWSSVSNTSGSLKELTEAYNKLNNSFTYKPQSIHSTAEISIDINDPQIFLYHLQKANRFADFYPLLTGLIEAFLQNSSEEDSKKIDHLKKVFFEHLTVLYQTKIDHLSADEAVTLFNHLLDEFSDIESTLRMMSLLKAMLMNLFVSTTPFKRLVEKDFMMQILNNILRMPEKPYAETLKKLTALYTVQDLYRLLAEKQKELGIPTFGLAVDEELKRHISRLRDPQPASAANPFVRHKPPSSPHSPPHPSAVPPPHEKHTPKGKK